MREIAVLLYPLPLALFPCYLVLAFSRYAPPVLMKRLVIGSLLVLAILLGAYFFNQYWIHRYDALIARQAAVYRLDPDLVWSIIYEETYFSPWKNGRDGEVGLMQITPAVGREWAAETGMQELERQMNQSSTNLLRDP